MKVSAYIYIHAIFSLSILCIQHMYTRFIYVYAVTVSLDVPLLLCVRFSEPTSYWHNQGSARSFFVPREPGPDAGGEENTGCGCPFCCLFCFQHYVHQRNLFFISVFGIFIFESQSC